MKAVSAKFTQCPLCDSGPGPAILRPRAQRNGQTMSLNNAGDEIVLLDPANVERDRFAYAASAEGTVIKTQH